MRNSREKVLLIKELIRRGYKDKHICMITQTNQPYVSKIRNGKIHKDTVLEENEKLLISRRDKLKLQALNKIISAPEIYTKSFDEQEIIYIHVLKFFMVDKEKIYNLYVHMSKTQFNMLWVKKDVDILNFNSELLQISKEVFLDLVIDYFL